MVEMNSDCILDGQKPDFTVFCEDYIIIVDENVRIAI